jgi:hypothetical protein
MSTKAIMVSDGDAQNGPEYLCLGREDGEIYLFLGVELGDACSGDDSEALEVELERWRVDYAHLDFGRHDLGMVLRHAYVGIVP